MQKKRKIIISIAISLGLALAATQISHDGWLKASIFGNLESCKNGTIKYIDTCEKPLKQEQTRIQGQINTLTTQITAKQKQCNTFSKQKKQPQEKKCRTQLAQLNANKAEQQKILTSITVSLTQLVARPAITPVIIRPINSTKPGCTDSTASNYDASANADDGSCIYDKCLDSTAQNYWEGLPCVYITTVMWCTNPAATNYNPLALVNGSCDFTPEIREWCTDPNAHNNQPGANTDNGSCQTCSDWVKNWDEDDVDCGGNKCSECAVGCKDPNATNYNPEAKKEGPCTYEVLVNSPQYYCDVPGATNYEKHDKTDTTYQASTRICNFCGNETREGVGVGDKVEPETLTGDTGTTVQVAEECEDGPNDKPYDGCSMCRIETCGDEIALCQAYKFTGRENESQVSSRLRKGLEDNSASKRPEWNNNRVDTVTSRDRDFATFGSICIRNKDEWVTSYSGRPTVFWLTAAGIDTEDNGLWSYLYGNLCRNCKIGNAPWLVTGYSGDIPTANKVIRWVAVPQEMLTEIFGTDVNIRKVRVRVTGPNGCFLYPIVDNGPDEHTWTRKCTAILDMTYAAANELWFLSDSTQKVQWKIIENAGEDPSSRLTPEEIKAGFTSMTFGNTNWYTYRSNTQLDYPQEYVQPTRC